MKYDLSNKVVARLNEAESTLPNRSLDLGNISTPELGLLSPNRNEIAPRGSGREAALFAYSERLRNNYKQNDGGLRDGMVFAWRCLPQRTADFDHVFLSGRADVSRRCC